MAAEPPLRPAAGYCLGRRRPRWRRPETTSKGRQHSLPRRAFVVLLGTAAAAAPRPRSAEASPDGGQSSSHDHGGERERPRHQPELRSRPGERECVRRDKSRGGAPGSTAPRAALAHAGRRRARQDWQCSADGKRQTTGSPDTEDSGRLVGFEHCALSLAGRAVPYGVSTSTVPFPVQSGGDATPLHGKESPTIADRCFPVLCPQSILLPELMPAEIPMIYMYLMKCTTVRHSIHS